MEGVVPMIQWAITWWSQCPPEAEASTSDKTPTCKFVFPFLKRKIIANMLLPRIKHRALFKKKVPTGIVSRLHRPVRLSYNPYFSACFFSQNSVFLSQQISE
jgi:hypothetical protein